MCLIDTLVHIEDFESENKLKIEKTLDLRFTFVLYRVNQQWHNIERSI